jgi:hypothetical protein
MDIDATANLVAPAPVLATVLSSNVKDADQVLELKSTKEMAIAKVRVESETPIGGPRRSGSIFNLART